MSEREAKMLEQAKNIGLGRYLSKPERVNLMILVAFSARVKKAIDEYQGTRVNKVILGMLKTGFGLVDRFLVTRMSSIQDDERQALMKDIHATEIASIQSRQLKKEREEMAKLNNIVPVEYGDMCKLLEGCMEGNCAGCSGKGSEVEGCQIKALYHKYKVPVFDANAPEEVCPYRYEAVPAAHVVEHGCSAAIKAKVPAKVHKNLKRGA